MKRLATCLATCLATGLLWLGLAAPLQAQGTNAGAATFDHSIRLIVPFAPGGTSDILARILAQPLTQALGQSVVVENRPGAAGNIGADAVAKSAPDGHTLLLVDAGILATAPSLFAKLPFDARKDLAPVSMLIYAPYILAVHPSLPVQRATDLPGFAKANGNRMNVATSGVGAANHLTALVLGTQWGSDMTYVPYRGGAAALAAASAGESNLIINGATATQPFVVNNQLRGLAVSGPKRLAALPDLPTFQELGWPAVESGTWQGLWAAGGTSPAMIARLDREFRAVLAQPAIAARMADLGGEVRAEGPEPLRRWLDAEIDNWGKVIKAANIRLD